MSTVSGQSRQSKRLTKRREAQFLLTAAVLTLVILSTFTLFSYRSTVELGLEERRQEASRMARRFARQLDGEPVPNAARLRRLEDTAAGIAVIDELGRAVAASGDVALTDPEAATRWLGWELAPPSSDTVSGRSPLAVDDGRLLFLRVDLPARQLRSSERGLDVLVPLVLLVNVTMTLLLLVYWQHLWAPFDRLIQRAKKAGRMGGDVDEMSFLLDTFEEAFEALQRSPGDELDALERTLVPNLESGVLLSDETGRVLALNKIGAAVLELEEPAEGRPLEEVLAPHPGLSTALLEAIREDRGVERGEYVLDLAAGERTLGLTMHPLRRDDGSLRGYLILFLDLTAVRRRAEERRLSENLAQLGELAAGVAHEARNALASLTGYLTLVERRALDDTIGGYLAEMRHEADHLKRVVDDFLSFARPGSARGEEVDLDPLLHRAAADPALGEVVVRFTVESEARGGARMIGDAQLLERAFCNLLRNAAEAETAGRGEAVEVALRRAGEEIEIVIGDRGPGLPEELRERLFHPFVSGRADGVGLGLALTHRIVELHHGSVRLEDRPGGGARAVVRLPAMAR